MAKKVFVIFLAVLFVAVGSVSWAKVTGKNAPITVTAMKKAAPTYEVRTPTAGESEDLLQAAKKRTHRFIGASRYAPQGTLTVPSVGTDRLLGNTFSETQGNASDGAKQCTVDLTGTAHTSWRDTQSGGRPATNRGVYWTCVTAGGAVVNPGGTRLPSTGSQNYRFSQNDFTPDGRSVLTGHRSLAACATPAGLSQWMAADGAACANSWALTVQGCMDTSLNLIWPDITTTADSTIHVIGTDSRVNPGATPFCYARSTDGGATWSVPSLITGTGATGNSAGPGRDTLAPGSYFPGTLGGGSKQGINLDMRLIGSRKSKQLALVYVVTGAPEQPGASTQASGNIWIRRSTDAGLSWEEAKALTCFDSTSKITAQTNQYSAIPSAIYDGNDDLHIIFAGDDYNTTTLTASFTGGTLYHMQVPSVIATGTDCPGGAAIATLHPIAPGNFPNDANLIGDLFCGSIVRPNLATPGILDGTKKGVLYAVWNQFSGADLASQNDTSSSDVGPLYNGELYAATSTDFGCTWSHVQNLTNTKTPGCGAGLTPNCASEQNAWVADIVKDSVNIIYTLDFFAGQLSGGVTTYPPGNEVHLLRVDQAALAPTLEPRLSASPGAFREVDLHPRDSMVLSVNVTNPGTATLNVTNVAVNGPDSPPLRTGVSTTSFSIATCVSTPTVVKCSLNAFNITYPVDALTPVVGYFPYSIDFTSNNTGGPVSVPIDLYVIDSFVRGTAQTFTSGTVAGNAASVALKTSTLVNSNGTIGENGTGMVYNQPPDTVYRIFHHGPVMMYGAGPTLVGYSYQATNTSALTDLAVDGDGAQTVVRSVFTGKGDSTIVGEQILQFPTGTANAEFIIATYRYVHPATSGYPPAPTAPTLAPVYLGGLGDWDIPNGTSSQGSLNLVGISLGDSLLFIYGTDPADSSTPLSDYGGYYLLDGGGGTIWARAGVRNAVYDGTNPPPDSIIRVVKDSGVNLALGDTGVEIGKGRDHSIWYSVKFASMGQSDFDLYAKRKGADAGSWLPASDSTLRKNAKQVTFALVTSTAGQSGLETNAATAKAWALAHPALPAGGLLLGHLKGDLTLDEVVDIGDIVSLIQCVVFSSSCGTSFCIPDVTDDGVVDVGDIVTEINDVVFSTPDYGRCDF